MERVPLGRPFRNRRNILHLKNFEIVAFVKILELEATEHHVEDGFVQAGCLRRNQFFVLGIGLLEIDFAHAFRHKQVLVAEAGQTVADLGRQDGHFVIGDVLERGAVEGAVAVTPGNGSIDDAVGGVLRRLHRHLIERAIVKRIVLSVHGKQKNGCQQKC